MWSILINSRLKLTKMGYELTRFQGEVDEELICPICSGVLEEPVQVTTFFYSKWHVILYEIAPTYGWFI